MNARSPYLFSSLGHAVALGLLATLSTMQRPPLVVPGLRLVALPGAGRGTLSGARVEPPAVAPPVVPPADRLPAPPPEPKPAKKSPPKVDASKPADPRGVQPARKQEIVSKTSGKSKPAAAARPTGPAAAAAATGAGRGTADGGRGQGGIGIEVEGDPGPLGDYLTRLRDRVATAWEPPPSIGRTGEIRAVVYFQMTATDDVAQAVRVQTSSGVGLFDRSALGAIQRARLERLPSGAGTAAIGIKFAFTQQY